MVKSKNLKNQRQKPPIIIKSDTFQEEDDQQAVEEPQATTSILEPVQSAVNCEPENPIPPTNHETSDNDDD